jgi:hypothetical protein
MKGEGYIKLGIFLAFVGIIVYAFFAAINSWHN